MNRMNELNAATALRFGLITWFEYFKLIRGEKIEKDQRLREEKGDENSEAPSSQDGRGDVSEVQQCP